MQKVCHSSRSLIVSGRRRYFKNEKQKLSHTHTNSVSFCSHSRSARDRGRVVADVAHCEEAPARPLRYHTVGEQMSSNTFRCCLSSNGVTVSVGRSSIHCPDPLHRPILLSVRYSTPTQEANNAPVIAL
ncbi:hypothetical protein EVAR_53066_1 [Eumeta japonica]|uniref:Uncharacterized protein n=1 Tax=Eumeta variegata TaxID=151549 RepID=A0A4C1YVE5_EUMVA|nr:hypothetical protein EVAR_53066_1 [Eumeta japonica]